MFKKPGSPSDALRDRIAKVAQRPANVDGPAPPPPVQTKSGSRAPRKHVFRNATLSWDEAHRLGVVIKDLSDEGARVEFFQNVTLPEIVTLIEPTLKLRRNARVVWQTNGAAGLQFVSS